MSVLHIIQFKVKKQSVIKKWSSIMDHNLMVFFSTSLINKLMSCLNNLALRVLEVFFRDARRVVHEHANKLNFCRFASSMQKISLFVGLRVTCIASLVFFTRFSLKKLMPCQTHRHISYSLFFTFASASRTNGVTYAHLKNKK